MIFAAYFLLRGGDTHIDFLRLLFLVGVICPLMKEHSLRLKKLIISQAPEDAMLKIRTPVYNTGSPSTKYEHQRTSPSVTRVVICLSRAFFSTDQEERDTVNVPIACRVTKMNLARVSSGSYRPRTQFAPGVPSSSFCLGPRFGGLSVLQSNLY